MEVYEKWWREILCHCDDISIVDRDFARCRYENAYPEPTHECCFEKCPRCIKELEKIRPIVVDGSV